MATSKSAEARKYKGGNVRLDRVLYLYPADGDVWVVNGQRGRRAVVLPEGSTKKEALTAYMRIYG